MIWTLTEVFTTLTEVFPCFFLGCKANARVILAKTRHGLHSSKIVVLFYVLFVLYRSMYCLCVNVYCHRATTQLQLTNISQKDCHRPLCIGTDRARTHVLLYSYSTESPV